LGTESVGTGAGSVLEVSCGDATGSAGTSVSIGAGMGVVVGATQADSNVMVKDRIKRVRFIDSPDYLF
jgi:hypothetical protein